MSAKSSTGILLAHRANMVHLIQKNPFAFEVSVLRQNQDTSALSKRLKYPMKALNVSYFNFGNPDVLGSNFALTKTYVFPIFSTRSNLFLDYSIGTGIAWITKHYDKFENPKNNAIGSHLNSKFEMQFNVSHYLKKFHYGLGISFVHFSNGSIQYPNLGINCPNVFVNVGYNFDERKRQSKNVGLNKRDVFNQYTDHTFSAELIGSVKEVSAVPLEAKRYPVLASRFSYVYRPGLKWGFETSTDLIYNEANRYYYANSNYTIGNTLQLGLYAGAVVYFHKSALFFGGGVYLYDKIDVAGKVYKRTGFQYHFSQRFYGSVAIKANFAKADYLEFGIAYKLIQSE